MIKLKFLSLNQLISKNQLHKKYAKKLTHTHIHTKRHNRTINWMNLTSSIDGIVVVVNEWIPSTCGRILMTFDFPTTPTSKKMKECTVDRTFEVTLALSTSLRCLSVR